MGTNQRISARLNGKRCRTELFCDLRLLSKLCNHDAAAGHCYRIENCCLTPVGETVQILGYRGMTAPVRSRSWPARNIKTDARIRLPGGTRQGWRGDWTIEKNSGPAIFH